MLHVITGGSGSGKSAYAEEKICSFGEGKRIYIATMYPFDEESHKRIARHRLMRKDKGFETIECYTGLKNVEIPKESCVLLECMSNLAANEMYQETGAKEAVCKEVLEGICHLIREAKEVVVVTNEVFSHTGGYGEETMEYLKRLGEINCEMGKMAEEVVEVVYGIAVQVKGV